MTVRTLALVTLGLAAFAQTAEANFIYGLSQASSGSKVELVHVNVATGTQSNFADLGNIGGSVNGLASVLGTAKFFFASGTKFYSYNHAATTNKLTTFAGNLGASVDDGAYYQGSYYYIRGSSLRKVTPGVSTFTESVVHTFATAFSTFGDISFNTTSTSAGDGTLFISSSGGIAKFNVNTNAFSVLNAGVAQMQLGFSQDNNLYGIFSGASTAVVEQVYRINQTTGARTLLSSFSNGASVYIRDAATAPTPPVPEPASLAVLGLGLAALKRRRSVKKG